MSDDWLELSFGEAVDYLSGLRPTPAQYLSDLEAEELANAFRVAGVTKLEILQEMLDRLNDELRNGGTVENFVADFADTGLSAGHLETVYRTNIQAAYGKGMWEQGTNSDIADALWGWRYHTVGDDRVRPEHEALDGEVFATDDREGQRVFPPWDFNCRCSAEWITTQEAEEEGYESADLPKEVSDALDETNFVSPALGDEYQPELGGYDAGLVAEYIAEQAE